MDANIVNLLVSLVSGGVGGNVGTSAIAGLVLPLVVGFIKKKLAGGR